MPVLHISSFFKPHYLLQLHLRFALFSQKLRREKIKTNRRSRSRILLIRRPIPLVLNPAFRVLYALISEIRIGLVAVATRRFVSEVSTDALHKQEVFNRGKLARRLSQGKRSTSFVSSSSENSHKMQVLRIDGGCLKVTTGCSTQINYYTEGKPIDPNIPNWFSGSIEEPSGNQYPADYHLFFPNEVSIADKWFQSTRHFNDPLHLIVFGRANVQITDDKDVNKVYECKIIFTEPAHTTLEDWASRFPLVDATYKCLTDRFREILKNILEMIQRPGGHGNLTPRNIYILNNQAKSAKMSQMSNDFIDFDRMVRSFFRPSSQIHGELSMFLKCVRMRRYGGLQRHPVLMNAKDRMRYRADAWKKITGCAYMQWRVDCDLTSVLPSANDWINNVVQKGPLSAFFIIMHFKTTKVPPTINVVPAHLYYLPADYTTSSFDFLKYNRNVDAHPPRQLNSAQIDLALNNLVPNFLPHLFEVLARNGLYC